MVLTLREFMDTHRSSDVPHYAACGVSSAVEHLPYKQGVTGSNPVPRTKISAQESRVASRFCLLATRHSLRSSSMFPLLKKKPRVLLLDDDPSMHRLVSSLLKREGYRVEAFLTGREAMQALDSQQYDVLLLDLMMPHEGGMTVIRYLRSKKPELLQRALLLTGLPQSVSGTVRNEVAGVVQKPFHPPELVGAIRRITEER